MTYENSDIGAVRRHLLDQLSALRGASVHTLERELTRSKGVSELAQTMTNIAKVEVDYLRATGQTRAAFFEAQPGAAGLPAIADESGGPRTALQGKVWEGT